MVGHNQCGGLEVQCQLEFNCSNECTLYKWNSWKNYWRARFGFRTVLKILRNGSFRSHWKHDQPKQRISLCLILIYRRFSVQFVTTTSQSTLSDSNGLVYKPHSRFLAQNLSKKVRLIHESLRYLISRANLHYFTFQELCSNFGGCRQDFIVSCWQQNKWTVCQDIWYWGQLRRQPIIQSSKRDQVILWCMQY